MPAVIEPTRTEAAALPPPELTPEIVAAIVKRVREGARPCPACAAEGFKTTVFTGWLSRGRSEPGSIYENFRNLLSVALITSGQATGGRRAALLQELRKKGLGLREKNQTHAVVPVPKPEPQKVTLSPVSDEAPANKPAAPSHTPNGKFAPGNKCGRGNPFARKMGAMRSAFLAAITPEDVQMVARRLLAQALAGNETAAALFLSYALGKPTRGVDVDRLDLDEWKLLAERPGFQDVLDVEHKADPTTASDFVKRSVGLTVKELGKQLIEHLKDKISSLRGDSDSPYDDDEEDAE
jgi:hypothetical protein